MDEHQMNKQIKELAEQAGLGLRWETTSQFEAFLEKFAELIVQECADLVDRAISDGGIDGRVVKEHFGVEE